MKSNAVTPQMFSKWRRKGDNSITFVKELGHAASLYRFINYQGIPYSAIVQNGFDLFSCETSYEDNMVHYFERMMEERYGQQSAR